MALAANYQPDSTETAGSGREQPFPRGLRQGMKSPKNKKLAKNA